MEANEETRSRMPLLLLAPSDGPGISIWPMVVPYTTTLWAASSAGKSQGFLMIGTLFLLPITGMYIGGSYWVFRGKVKSQSAGH